MSHVKVPIPVSTMNTASNESSDEQKLNGPPSISDGKESETCGLIDGESCEAHVTSATDGEESPQRISLHQCKTGKFIGASAIFLIAAVYLAARSDHVRLYFQGNRKSYRPTTPHHKKKKKPKVYPAFPAKALLGVAPVKSKGTYIQSKNSHAPYDPFNDFQYGPNRTLLYWEEVVDAIEQYKNNATIVNINETDSAITVWSNLSTWGACYPRALPERRLRGYSYTSKRQQQPPLNRNWTSIVQSNTRESSSIVYPRYKKDYFRNEDELLEGHCRPSFLIIGQGKCGTSSLYHYLTGHPRVLPASEKQVHYFLYHTHQSLKWYYSHFPSIESFLGRGALMSGEASPGYMPYPSVLEMVVKRLSTDNIEEDGKKKGLEEWRRQVNLLPKIIAIVREPIDRAISSYKYNYVTPALERMRSGTGLSANGESIPGGKSDLYYMKHHMFSLQELAVAELEVLRQCLQPGGQGEKYTRNRYAKYRDLFFYDTVKKRIGSDLPHLIHLDGACYQESSSLTVPRAQWTKLGRSSPNKILALPDLQLVQSIIGRGLYAFPLEWWYEVFGSNSTEREARIQVVCNEDLANAPVDTMENVTKFLGLPVFHSWENVTNVGRYNVGSVNGHRGYDSVEDELSSSYSDASTDKAMTRLTTISDSLRSQLNEFYEPYNERLFRLIGKSCPWKY